MYIKKKRMQPLIINSFTDMKNIYHVFLSEKGSYRTRYILCLQLYKIAYLHIFVFIEMMSRRIFTKMLQALSRALAE